MNKCQLINLTIQRLCNSGTPLLPPEYQQVEYIANSGRAYINTGISPSDDFGARAVYMQTDAVSVSNVYGTVLRSGVGYFGVNIDRNRNLYYSWGTIYSTNSKITLNTLYEDSLNYLNNRKYVSVYGEFALANVTITTAPVYVFDFNNNGTGFASQPFIGRVYEIEFTRGSSVVSHCIPCYRKSDNKPGMYDLVTNTFYTNAGTGEFTVGNNV